MTPVNRVLGTNQITPQQISSHYRHFGIRDENANTLTITCIGLRQRLERGLDKRRTALEPGIRKYFRPMTKTS